MTPAGFATVPVRSMPAVVPVFHPVTATATATSLTPSASAAALARRIRTATAYATMQRCQVARTRLPATSTPQLPMMIGTCESDDAIGVCGGTALRMRTATASATMSTTASAPLTPAGFATVPVRSMPAVVPVSHPATATATATSWTPWASVAAPARRIRMATAYATSQRFQVARIRLPATMTLRQRMTTAPVKRQTLWAIAVVIAVRMQMATASVTMSTTASAPLTPAGFATVPAEIYACGCSRYSSPGLRLRRQPARCLGVCGGTCTSDADGDGICDDVDDCVGTLDACGICNGPGEIYACGCAGIPSW